MTRGHEGDEVLSERISMSICVIQEPGRAGRGVVTAGGQMARG